MHASLLPTLGQIAAIVTQHARLPATMLDALACTPAKALDALQQHPAWAAAWQHAAPELHQLLGSLPANWRDAPDGSPIADRPLFWAAYYQRHLHDSNGQPTPALLADIGAMLYGTHWQAPMAEMLQLSDTARIRQWLSKGRIPLGVWAELIDALHHQHLRAAALLDTCQSIPARSHHAGTTTSPATPPAPSAGALHRR